MLFHQSDLVVHRCMLWTLKIFYEPMAHYIHFYFVTMVAVSYRQVSWTNRMHLEQCTCIKVDTFS